MSDISFLSVSPALSRISGLATMLGAPVVNRHLLGVSWLPESVSAVLAWGRKPSSIRAGKVAERLGLPVLRLEDGFLRSVEPGAHEAPLSLIVDDLGIYYDASAPSRLEKHVQELLTEERQARVAMLVRAWCTGRVSKYNHGREQDCSALKPYVLVVDQTFGDASVTYGQADADSFERMLAAALMRYPEHQVVIKTHPDVVAGRKRGYLAHLPQALDVRITLITDNVHPPSLIEHCEAMFCVTSQMGFESLLWGKPVHVFGMPFYAGWGLTRDELPAPSRRTPVSLEQLVYAALVQYPRYRHPETGKLCEVETVLDWLALQRNCRERFPETLYGTRFPFWKRNAIKRFLGGSQLRTVASAEKIREEATRVVWGSVEAREPVVRIEDGFIRSAGLGVDLTQPQSWVLDDLGMYYDARRPSRLEAMMELGGFDPEVLDRADLLRHRLVASGTTKYNTGRGRWQKPAGVATVILVPGQVESDASIRFGSTKVKSNLQLLQLVRSVNPDAWLIYKPHPDVVAGIRLAGEHENQAYRYCDEVVLGDDMAHLLSPVDAVHTLTSLTGFEALLRGVEVTCYGQPFYAGWGLTKDIYPLARRTRKASLNELVAAALILYPTYISRVTGRFTTVEQVIDEIAEQRRLSGDRPTVFQRLSRLLRTSRKF